MARKADPAVRMRWRTLLLLQAQSGLSIAQFCREHGCSPASLYLWRRRLAEQPDPPPPDAVPPAAFLPVRLTPASQQPACLRVSLASGAIIEIPAEQTETLLRLVDHLERPLEAIQS